MTFDKNFLKVFWVRNDSICHQLRAASLLFSHDITIIHVFRMEENDEECPFCGKLLDGEEEEIEIKQQRGALNCNNSEVLVPESRFIQAPQ